MDGLSCDATGLSASVLDAIACKSVAGEGLGNGDAGLVTTEVDLEATLAIVLLVLTIVCC